MTTNETRDGRSIDKSTASCVHVNILNGYGFIRAKLICHGLSVVFVWMLQRGLA